MTRPLSRRFFLSSALATLAAPALAEAPAVSLRPVLRPASIRAAQGAAATEALIAKARLSGEVGFAVLEAATGGVLEARAAGTGLPPASVTKAVTALYALETLGAEHRFATRLIATGPLRDGVLDGDLVLAGGGDPTLDTDALADMAAALKRAGLREVRGGFKVWGGALPYLHAIYAQQPVHVGYNPALSGLSLNYNRVHFEWRAAGGTYALTMDARSSRYRPEVTVARMRVADRAAPVYTYSDAGTHDAWTVARGALGGGGARWLPVRKPALYAGEVFATFARAQGIVLKAPAEIDGTALEGATLVTHESAALADILRDMLRYSTNITAEMVGMAASAKRRGRPVTHAASAREMTGWAKATLGMAAADLRDHSGLSDRSRLSAEDMARALAATGRREALRPLMREVAMRDAQGRPVKGHEVKVQAKTGTLFFVSTLAGYVTPPGGRELVFAVLSASDSLRSRINPARDERPAGARGWNLRAKRLQQALIERWSATYGG
ncbi:D-alanyl-D-alanine carboxypeptidase/D-alanyl-D-alanine-endopeptidase (penicillin-binding protein 4) [Roseovarius sp. MBR-78]|uniref:D-alanyl-D-alanine carboxypeptidase/D-alanyl-D-alanine endopeptidase n=1 Tax=Roseovarius sp. MBR-78 TaxID=3156460 RepID=UPI003395D578